MENLKFMVKSLINFIIDDQEDLVSLLDFTSTLMNQNRVTLLSQLKKLELFHSKKFWMRIYRYFRMLSKRNSYWQLLDDLKSLKWDKINRD